METHNVEYKQSWRDEYLKWICGFANAQGGKLYIGKDDDGNTVGLADCKKLSEDIPNKVMDVLGVVVDVNIMTEDGKECIEIVVPAYSNPINYKGEYHYRSGSTKKELKGQALNEFLLAKTGKCWEGMTVPGVEVKDLSEVAFERFRTESLKSDRSDEDIMTDSREDILTDLQLVDLQNGQLTKAAILLFHPRPELFVPGAFERIGYFLNDDEELAFQDEVRGSIMEQIEKAKDLLKTKYAYPLTSFDGNTRKEVSPYPDEAIRESLLNSLAHKDYANPTPIQISVYPDHIVFWNPGQLPESITPQMLFVKHPSIPRNPLIAGTLFRCGDIDTWGRGYKRIMKAIGASKLLPPRVEQVAGTMVTYYRSVSAQLKSLGVEERLMPIVELAAKNGSVTNGDVQKLYGVSRNTATRMLGKLSDILVSNGEKGLGAKYSLIAP